MKKSCFVVLLVLIPIVLYSTDSTEGLFKIIYFLNKSINRILDEQKSLNINEYIFFDYGHEPDTVQHLIKKGIITKKYRKNHYGASTFFIIYKQNEEWYAKMITDTAIYKSIKLNSDIDKYFNYKKIKSLAFNKTETKNDYLPVVGSVYYSSIIYWNKNDLYYFYSDYRDKKYEGCYTSKRICQARRDYIDSLTIEIRKILPLLELESYHNYGYE